MILIDANKPQYRANFHTHTTESDGRRTPQEAMALYREAGYDILAITDHRKVTDPAGIPDGLLLIRGAELDYLLPGQAVHLLGLGIGQEVCERWTRESEPQDAIDLIHGNGGVCVLAHPAWSMNDPATMASFRGVDATEIWNSVSTLPYNAPRADSSNVLDTLWSNHPGTLMPVMANDDTHFYGDELFAGWNMVQADALTGEAVLDAIRRGAFYATQGPVFEELAVKDGDVKVRCSRVRTIVFMSNSPWVSTRVFTGEDLTEATYRFTKRDSFCRVQLIDADGHCAWSRPFKADGTI